MGLIESVSKDVKLLTKLPNSETWFTLEAIEQEKGIHIAFIHLTIMNRLGKRKVSAWSVRIFWRCWLSDMWVDVILCWICKGKSHAIIPNFRLLVPVITIYYTVLQIKWDELNMLTYMKAKYRGQAPSGVWMLLPSNGSTPSTDDIEISFCTRN